MRVGVDLPSVQGKGGSLSAPLDQLVLSNLLILSFHDSFHHQFSMLKRTLKRQKPFNIHIFDLATQ